MTPVIFVDLDETLVRCFAHEDGLVEKYQRHLDRLSVMHIQTTPQGDFRQKMAGRVAAMRRAPIVNVNPEQYLVLVRPGAQAFLEALGQLGDVVILSSGDWAYVQEVVRVTGLRPLVKSVHSTRDNPVFNIQGPWLLVDDMSWASVGVSLKCHLISTEAPNPDNLVQVAAYSGIPDEELVETLRVVRDRLGV